MNKGNNNNQNNINIRDDQQDMMLLNQINDESFGNTTNFIAS